MSDTASGNSLIDLTLDSNLGSVDHAEELVVNAADRMGFDDEDQHKIGIAIRECMVNAVAHGNRYSAKKKVRLQVWTDSGKLIVHIGDEGNGFEAVAVPDPLAQENLLKHSGRGLLMIQAFMDEFIVRKREPAGTEVRLVKRLPAKSSEN